MPTRQEKIEFIAMAKEALKQTKGDDLYLYRLSFKNMPESEMKKEYAHSGYTRREILDECESRDKEIDLAIEWLDEIKNGLGE